MNQSGGSLFLFNKRVLRFFRKDGHAWRKKRDGRTVGEAHERLKVGNVEALNCYYAHGETNPNFQRRSYWMLDPAYEHIVLVHYRDISEGGQSSPVVTQLSPGSTATSPTSITVQNPGSVSTVGDLYESCQKFSPGSIEVSSEMVNSNGGVQYSNMTYGAGIQNSASERDVSKVLRRLEEQLSLDDDNIKEFCSFGSGDDISNDSGIQDCGKDVSSHRNPTDLLNGTQYIDSDCNGENYQQLFGHENAVQSNAPLSWTEMLESCKTSSGSKSQEDHIGSFNENDNFYRINFDKSSAQNGMSNSGVDGNSRFEVPASSGYQSGFDESLVFPPSMLLPQQVGSTNYYATTFDRGHNAVQLEANLSLTISQKQKFKIQQISPEWGYATETTKVIIVGAFLCDPAESLWTCMIGDKEIPLQIIQEGVICCFAPPHVPGKTTLCITSGNREACSEVREFEYRVMPSSCGQCNSHHADATKSPDELLVLVRFAQMLLSDSSMRKVDPSDLAVNSLGNLKADEDSWGHIIDNLLVGCGTSSSITEWLLEELLKDKLQQWLSSRFQEGCDCSLSKNEQGIIHMVSALGFEWALNPILNHLVNINFRDIKGWTALHWAAHFGREKMVAALTASGAFAGAVTDPTPQDPTGKSAASIAATNGHRGVAGYLSEVALTSHLSSLTLEESELSKVSADVEAEKTVNSISNGNISISEDHLSLKDTLAAVRNAAQAAARIQAAFRAHSFQRRQQKNAANDSSASVITDEYGISPYDIKELSTASKHAFRNVRDYNLAALSIQKKYRGWKGRKDFLALRQKVIKIQAHVRGHQVRKQYRVCWAVGVLEKVVLRWRRRGVGLRGYRPESETVDESEDEDILKVFRKQKVDAAIDEAVSRVLSMVESPDARQQYRRILEKYRQAKAERGGGMTEETYSPESFGYMEDEDIYPNAAPRGAAIVTSKSYDSDIFNYVCSIITDCTCHSDKDDEVTAASAIDKDEEIEVAIRELMELSSNKFNASSDGDSSLADDDDQERRQLLSRSLSQ
ncbi:IPT domain, partial [Dillenia turbinata]